VEKYSVSETGKSFGAGQFFQAVGSFFGIFLGSFLIGSIIGCVNALLTKFTKIGQHPGLETALFMLISYSAFLASEAAEFSGIVSSLICGIFQAHYTFNNLSQESQAQTKQVWAIYKKFFMQKKYRL
jgi:NhaP-type Na+/H+ or K+/H+ antiporter